MKTFSDYDISDVLEGRVLPPAETNQIRAFAHMLYNLVHHPEFEDGQDVTDVLSALADEMSEAGKGAIADKLRHSADVCGAIIAQSLRGFAINVWADYQGKNGNQAAILKEALGAMTRIKERTGGTPVPDTVN